MSQCPCGSGKLYAVCCEPYLKQISFPKTAEALMRSRYCAYVKGDMDYIRNTYHPSKQGAFDSVEAMQWSQRSQWLGLEILSTIKGCQDDVTGFVEFRATYRLGGVLAPVA